MTKDEKAADLRKVAKINRRLDGAYVQIKDTKGSIVYFDEDGPHPELTEIFNRHAAAMLAELQAKGSELEERLKNGI